MKIKFLFLTLVGIVLLAGYGPQGAALSASPTPTAAPAKAWAEVTVRGLRVRTGPGIEYPPLGALKQGDTVDIVGREAASGWLQIVYDQAADGVGWISGKEPYVEIKGSLEDVPNVEAAPPPYTPRPEPTSPEIPENTLPGKLVFQTANQGDIYIINANGTALRRLTDGLDPSWSPDGSRVTFARWREPKGIWVINQDGSDEHRIFDWPGAKAPTFSPDETRIVFTRQYGGPLHYSKKRFYIRVDGVKVKVGSIIIPADPWWKLGVISPAGAQDYFLDLHCHDHSYSPDWSPDGERIVYASDVGLSFTWEQDATAQLTRDPNVYRLTDYWRDRAPVWSPDGRRLAFQTYSHDHYEIVVINADGAGRTQLTKNSPLNDRAINCVSPAWSPEGQYLVYLTDEKGPQEWEFYVMNADGSDQRPLFQTALAGVEIQYDNVDERVVDWTY